jgi:hypothetical protein
MRRRRPKWLAERFARDDGETNPNILRGIEQVTVTHHFTNLLGTVLHCIGTETKLCSIAIPIGYTTLLLIQEQ